MSLVQNISEFDNIPPKYIRKNAGDRYTIVKYSKRTFYDKAWDSYPMLQQARGHIFDNETGNIVARPFDKVFNYTENNAGLDCNLDTLVLLTEKINGFLGVLTKIDGELYISTAGAFCKLGAAQEQENDFLCMFEDKIKHIGSMCIDAGHSMMFEVVHEDDPHIIKQKHGCYFLGSREIATGNFSAPVEVHGCVNDSEIMIPTTETLSFADAIKKSQNSEGEGYMISYDNMFICKIKSKRYLTTKFLARTSVANIDKQHSDEEVQMIVDTLKERDILEMFKQSDAQARIAIIESIL